MPGEGHQGLRTWFGGTVARSPLDRCGRPSLFQMLLSVSLSLGQVSLMTSDGQARRQGLGWHGAWEVTPGKGSSDFHQCSWTRASRDGSRARQSCAACSHCVQTTYLGIGWSLLGPLAAALGARGFDILCSDLALRSLTGRAHPFRGLADLNAAGSGSGGTEGAPGAQLWDPLLPHPSAPGEANTLGFFLNISLTGRAADRREGRDVS